MLNTCKGTKFAHKSTIIAISKLNKSKGYINNKDMVSLRLTMSLLFIGL